MSNPWELTGWDVLTAKGGTATRMDADKAIELAAQRKLVEWLKRYEAGVDSTGFQRFTLLAKGWQALCADLGVAP